MSLYKPLLSLCIPTNGATQWVIPVITSIYNQNVDNLLFEIIIADNNPKSDLEHALSIFNNSNLHYHRTSVGGFINQIECFKLAKGEYRKMLNHRSLLLDGSLERMINIVKSYSTNKPIIYFSDGRIKNKAEIVTCENMDKFASIMGHWLTWSAGVGIWGNDISSLNNINIDPMFPHLAVIFSTRTDSNCVICNYKYLNMQSDAGKGGYDVFHTFAVLFLNLITEYVKQGKIGVNSYNYIKNTLHNFLGELYYTEMLRPRMHSFIIKNIRKSVCLHYGYKGYFLMILKAFLFFPVSFYRKTINFIITK